MEGSMPPDPRCTGKVALWQPEATVVQLHQRARARVCVLGEKQWCWGGKTLQSHQEPAFPCTHEGPRSTSTYINSIWKKKYMQYIEKSLGKILRSVNSG